jgi:tetratricopeptide (TPR) repeat protein
MLKNISVIVLVVLTYYSPVEAQQFDPARAPYEQAVQRYLKEDFDGAIADFNRAIALSTVRVNQRNPAARFDFTAEASRSSEITFISPVITAAYAGRALARYHNGDISGAIADCDSALSLNPGLAEVYNNRGAMRWKEGDRDGAIADFERLIKLKPNDPQGYDNRGSVLLDKGNIVGALADFERAIALSPRKAEFYCSRGQARQEAGDLDGGLADCELAIKLDPQLARASYCRGTGRYLKNDLAGAIAAFSRAIELDRNMAVAHGNLGWVFWQLGRKDEAEKEFAECVRLDPSLKAKLERRINEAKPEPARQ